MSKTNSSLVQIDAETSRQWDRSILNQLSDKIRKTEMFGDFADDEIDILANYARAYNVEAGMPILREGDVDCYMCLVIEGEIDIFRECGDGCRVKLSTVRPGQTLGEMSLIDGLPNSATAIASTTASLVLFSKRHFLTLAAEQPELSCSLMWKLAELLSLRLRRMSGKFVDSTVHTTNLKAARDDAMAAALGQMAFLAGMSHELRTPLNAIIGYGELLKEIENEDENQSGRSHDELDKILGASKHLLTLINDILDLSKAEAGKLELFTEQFNLPAFLSDVVSVLQPLADKNRNRLQLDCEETLATVCMDKTKLRQILYNFVSNACKFTKEGSIFVSASTVMHNDKRMILFKVRDTGMGIDEEQQKKLFQPFSQANASIANRFGGTGLGLAICKRLADIMDGSIGLESKPGSGSIFFATLPADVSPSSG